MIKNILHRLLFRKVNRIDESPKRKENTSSGKRAWKRPKLFCGSDIN